MKFEYRWTYYLISTLVKSVSKSVEKARIMSVGSPPDNDLSVTETTIMFLI